MAIATASAVSLHFQSPGDDLSPWLSAVRDLVDGGAVYDDPRFLYPPGSPILGLPFLLLPDFEARLAVRLVLAAAVVAGTVLSALMVDRSPGSWVAAVGLLAVVCSPPFHWGLLLANLGLVLVLALAAFLLLLVRGREGAAGVILGVSLALKPVLAPLLVLLLLTRRWRALAFSGAAGGGLVILGLVATSDGTRFFTSTTPFLLSGQDRVTRYSNASLLGLALQYDLHGAWLLGLRVLVLAVAVGSAWWILRRHPYGLPSAYVDSATVLLLGAFLGLSVAFDHYSLLLIPLAYSAALGRSIARPMLLWPGLALLLLSFPLPAVLDRYWTPSEYAFVAFAACLLALIPHPRDFLQGWRTGPPSRTSHAQA